jgi:hypothetical protein
MAFKRSLFGYRPREVDRELEARDTALAARDAALAEGAAALASHAVELERRRVRIAELELVCDRLCEVAVERDRELVAMRAELTAAGLRLAKLEAIGPQARGQATRIRMRALHDAVELSARLEELTKSPTADRGRLLDSLRGAIERLGADPDGEVVPAESNGHGRRTGDEIFEGLVEVEVGPLADFSQLVGFEDAAGEIHGTSEISVRRFASGRATLELKLAEPVELLRELEERAPFEFRVRDRRFDRLVLDVDAE